MISIVSSTDREDRLEIYRQWVSREWDDDHSFAPPKGSLPLPPPLLALARDELVGGISFTWYPAPETSELALWINTVYVRDAYRRKGIALQLIEAAERIVLAEFNATELLVYTNVPGLYAKNGWEIVSQDNDMWVLRKPL
ncbi:MAG: GNAT family N-acetyltransferase [Pseudohongiellaceae bacterium]